MISKVTLRQLRAFVAVAEGGRFVLAARRVHVSQSALSTLIRELEEALGVRLFDRNTRSVRLTPSGEQFLERARRVLQELDQALQVTRDITTFHRGRVSVACSTVLSSTLVVPFLKAFQASYAGIRLELLDLAEQGIQRAVLDEKADIGIGTQAQTDPELTATPLFRDAYRAVLPQGHRLAERGSCRGAFCPRSPGSRCHRLARSGAKSRHTSKRTGSRSRSPTKYRFLARCLPWCVMALVYRFYRLTRSIRPRGATCCFGLSPPQCLSGWWLLSAIVSGLYRPQPNFFTPCFWSGRTRTVRCWLRPLRACLLRLVKR